MSEVNAGFSASVVLNVVNYVAADALFFKQKATFYRVAFISKRKEEG